MGKLFALLFGAIIGVVGGLFLALMPWSTVLGYTEVGVANNSGRVVKDLTIQAGNYQHAVQRLQNGARSTVLLTPEVATELVISFECNNQRITVKGGTVEPKGDDRTLTILEQGKTVILTYGSSASVVEAAPADVQAVPIAPPAPETTPPPTSTAASPVQPQTP